MGSEVPAPERSARRRTVTSGPECASVARTCRLRGEIPRCAARIRGFARSPARWATRPDPRRSTTPMEAFRQLDFMALEEELTEDQRMVRDTVRAWVTERFM